MTDQARALLAELVAATKRRDETGMDADVLIPETDTVWPDGYDFDELERAQGEADLALRAYLDVLARVEAYLRGTP